MYNRESVKGLGLCETAAQGKKHQVSRLEFSTKNSLLEQQRIKKDRTDGGTKALATLLPIMTYCAPMLLITKVILHLGETAMTMTLRQISQRVGSISARINQIIIIIIIIIIMLNLFDIRTTVFHKLIFSGDDVISWNLVRIYWIRKEIFLLRH
jgi:hypothetical protein